MCMMCCCAVVKKVARGNRKVECIPGEPRLEAPRLPVPPRSRAENLRPTALPDGTGTRFG